MKTKKFSIFFILFCITIVLSFGTIKISSSFDWNLFLIIFSFSLVLLEFHRFVMKNAESSKNVKNKKFELYLILKSKENIELTLHKIDNSRQKNIIKKVYINYLIQYKDLNQEKVEEMIKRNELIAFLNEKKLNKKTIKKIKNHIKEYYDNQFLIDTYENYVSKELIKTQNPDIVSNLIAIISLVLSIWSFFNLNLDNTINNKRILYFWIITGIYICYSIIDTLISYKEYKKIILDFYDWQIKIWEDESYILK